MNKTMKKKKVVVTLINLLIIISTIIITINGFKYGAGSGQVGEEMIGFGYFKPYTIDSNIFMAICCLTLCISFLFNKKVKDNIFKFFYVGAVTITLTFITVVLFLFPTMLIRAGFKVASSLFRNDMLFFHVLNPILSVVCLFLLKDNVKLTFKDNLLALIPMIVYGIVYIYNVVIAKNWMDFYGFTFGGKMYLAPISAFAMVLATYLIGFLFRKCINK